MRGLLALGWVVIIVSLFWDPLTPRLTEASNTASPFHLQGKQVLVQGQVLPEEPYAMGNRIFWTMLIPLLPLFFMVAGHEAWRRLCPLSFISQIPRYLGMQRKRPVLDKRSGKVARLLALPNRDGWARRNVWYIQFGLLFLGLNARLLFVNSDRTALAVFFIFIIVAAITVGALYGGKTWCNYVCPIAVVQKIYTQPRGLLESAGHLERQPISQSMCRAPSPEGDRSICVGCTQSCPDIDLERSHWDGIDETPRRNVYYMFFGLVLGFYCFYYIYSGGWDYYFSGAWTHERDQLATLWAPGIYLAGHAIPIPKLLAAPLVLGLFVFGALGLGIALERGYRALRIRLGKPLPDAELRNQCLVFCAYITINAFYLFGGRPNLGLLPGPALKAVDIAIVALSTLWFWQAMQRTPVRYRRESLASSLLQQLRALKVNLSKYLEDRKLEELKPDEVYVLAKTLPQFSAEQKIVAYRNILEDALRQGRTNSAASLEMLREVRTELGVNDEEHRRLIDELGVGADASFDPDQAASYENWIRVDNYRRSLELAIIGPLERGEPLAAVLETPAVREAIAQSRTFYHITPAEHEAVLSRLVGGGGLVFERAKAQLDELCRLASLRVGIAGFMPRDDDTAALGRLLSKVLRRRVIGLCARQFSVLLALGETAEGLWLAENLANMLGRDLEAALARPMGSGTSLRWEQSLPAQIVTVLRCGGWPEGMERPSTLPPPVAYRAVLDGAINLAQNLAALAAESEPSLQALALTALSYLDIAAARQVATSLAANEDSHWLVREAIASVLSDDARRTQATKGFRALTVTVATPNAPTATTSLNKPYITVGRDASNDVVIQHPAAAPFHFALSLDRGVVSVHALDRVNDLFVDGARMDAAAMPIRSGTRIALRQGDATPMVVATWDAATSGEFTLQNYDTISKMIWLSAVPVFEDLDLEGLVGIAEAAEVRLYGRGAWLCRAGEPSSDAFFLQAGEMDVIGRYAELLGRLGPGAIVGEIGVITQQPRAASVRVHSEVARVVTLAGDRLRALIKRDAGVSSGLLVGVARYVGTATATPAARNVEEAA